jgi:MoxR-like ATPase
MEENTTTLDIRAINEKIERECFIDLLTMEMNKVIVGQET